MNILISTFIITLIECASGTRQQVTFYKEIRFGDASTVYDVEETCVNLDPVWKKTARSVSPHGGCVVLYSEKDCTGDSVIIFPTTRGQEMLAEVNFEDKAVSFKKCNSQGPNPSAAQPLYNVTMWHAKGLWGFHITLSLTSGECKTLPTDWHTRARSVSTTEQCFVVFDKIDCTGEKKFLSSIYSAPGSPRPGARDLYHAGFEGRVVSVKTCELMLQHPCGSFECPKFLYVGSLEYNFWMYYFSIYMRSRRSVFEERVKNSTTGYIEWDFLLPAIAKNRSLGYQYQDALESQRLVVRALRASRPGRWGFKTGNVETMQALVKLVSDERRAQLVKFKEDLNDPNFNVIIQLNDYWGTMNWYLDEILTHWKRKSNSGQKPCPIGSARNNPKSGTHGSDIILIVLEEAVTFGKYVRPVCLDWDNTIFDTKLGDIKVGRVVGWGVTSNDELSDPSEYLLKGNLPFISHSECSGKLRHLTNDNFCGGSEGGQGTQRGDSGGGFVFKYKNRYYLRGIVSTKDKSSQSSISAFTDVSFYISWIRNYV